MRDVLLEAVASVSEELMEKFLMEEPFTDEEKHQDNIRTYKLVWEAAKAALDDMKERTERLALHDATLQAVDLYKEQKSKGESLRQIAEELQTLSDENTKKTLLTMKTLSGADRILTLKMNARARLTNLCEVRIFNLFCLLRKKLPIGVTLPSCIWLL